MFRRNGPSFFLPPILAPASPAALGSPPGPPQPRFPPRSRLPTDSQSLAQRQFQRRHLTRIGLVVVPQQMQCAVENQPADFDTSRMTFRPSVAPHRLGGDYHITQKIPEFARPGEPSVHFLFAAPGKRQDIRSPRLAAVGGIQPLHFRVVDEADVEIPLPQAQRTAEPADEGTRGRQIQRDISLAVQNQGASRRRHQPAVVQGFLRPGSTVLAKSNSS